MSTPHRTPTVAALKACGLKVMAARNGHGVRWARAQCARDLQVAGHAAADAAALADSMTRFSTGFAARADALVAAYTAGASAP